MSLEDLDSEFKSDESDYEAEKKTGDGQKEDDDDDNECNYWDLYNLHLNLRCFQHIYRNNDIIDMESNSDDGPRFDFESMVSEMQFIDLLEDGHVQDLIQMYDEMPPTASSTSSSSSSSASSSSSSSSNSNLNVASDVPDG